MHVFAAFELGRHTIAFCIDADGNHFLAEAKNRSKLTQLKAEVLNNLPVDKIQQHRTLIEQSDFCAQGGKHGSIFQTDDASAHHDEFARNLYCMGIEETRVSLDSLHRIPAQLGFDYLDFTAHHALGADSQVRHPNIVFHCITAAIKSPLPQAAQIKDRFAESFAGNCSGVNAHAANGSLALDNGNFLAKLSGADRAFLACRATADDHQIVFSRIH